MLVVVVAGYVTENVSNTWSLRENSILTTIYTNNMVYILNLKDPATFLIQ